MFLVPELVVHEDGYWLSLQLYMAWLCEEYSYPCVVFLFNLSHWQERQRRHLIRLLISKFSTTLSMYLILPKSAYLKNTV